MAMVLSIVGVETLVGLWVLRWLLKDPTEKGRTAAPARRGGPFRRHPAAGGAPLAAEPPRVLTRGQVEWLVGLLAAVACGIVFAPLATVAAINGLLILFLMSAYGFKLVLIASSLRGPAPPRHDRRTDMLVDLELPIYTVLLPVFREATVLPQLVAAIRGLAYPPELLDVKLLLERDDDETRRAAAELELPDCFEVLVVPDVGPRGKARACNHGLSRARGKFLVIYDAEDCPDADQLMAAVRAFRTHSARVVCLQARLNFFNRDHNLLTRWFTAEYSVWFDQLLPGLAKLDAPIPLGGTSNHFVTARIRELGGWDVHNVTEDAELGMRIFMGGGRTAMLDTTTYEEATSRYGNWLRQRSRWVKGYMQTYLLYMRHPIPLWRKTGSIGFATFQLFFGANTLCLLLNPLYWGLVAVWFAWRPLWVERIFPAPIFYVALVGLLVGNGACMLAMVSGCYIRRNYADVKWAVLSPVYWLLMSAAAYKALAQLIYRPWHWEKTDHGFCALDVGVVAAAGDGQAAAGVPVAVAADGRSAKKPHLLATFNGSGSVARPEVRPAGMAAAITAADLSDGPGDLADLLGAGMGGAVTLVPLALPRADGAVTWAEPGSAADADRIADGFRGASPTASGLAQVAPARLLPGWAHSMAAVAVGPAGSPGAAPSPGAGAAAAGPGVSARAPTRSRAFSRMMRHELTPVVAVASVAAIAATVWSLATHSMLLYGDAAAHLDVARRVTDGLRQGLAQLGSVWLPLPHLLLVPLVAINGLWHTGLAGAAVSGTCFVYTTVRVYTLVRELSGGTSRIGAWCGVAVTVCNLNLLYMQTTPLTEPVLLAFTVGAAFHLARWLRTFSMSDLAWAAVLTTCATLARYEGWALLAAESLVVIVWGRIVDRRRKSPQANTLLFVLLGCYGVALWFVYNLVIFGDPLYFLHSVYSAEQINGGQARFGLLGTKGHLGTTLLTFGWDLVDVVGPAPLAVAGVGLVLALLPATYRRRRLLVLAVLAAPVLFEIVALDIGQITIRVPQLAPHQLWNDRYGLMALPMAAVVIGCAVAGSRVRAVAAVGAVAAGGAIMALASPITLADGRHGISSANDGRPPVVARYLRRHYAGGEILADDLAASSVMFESGLDLDQYISPGFHPFWERALAAPAFHVRWVLAYPGDAVSDDLAAHPRRFDAFRRVLVSGRATLLERRSNLAPGGRSGVGRVPPPSRSHPGRPTSVGMGGIATGAARAPAERLDPGHGLWSALGPAGSVPRTDITRRFEVITSGAADRIVPVPGVEALRRCAMTANREDSCAGLERMWSGATHRARRIQARAGVRGVGRRRHPHAASTGRRHRSHRHHVRRAHRRHRWTTTHAAPHGGSDITTRPRLGLMVRGGVAQAATASPSHSTLRAQKAAAARVTTAEANAMQAAAVAHGEANTALSNPDIEQKVTTAESTGHNRTGIPAGGF